MGQFVFSFGHNKCISYLKEGKDWNTTQIYWYRALLGRCWCVLNLSRFSSWTQTVILLCHSPIYDESKLLPAHKRNQSSVTWLVISILCCNVLICKDLCEPAPLEKAVKFKLLHKTLQKQQCKHKWTLTSLSTLCFLKFLKLD